MNSVTIKKYAPSLALILLFTNACFCFDTTTTAAVAIATPTFPAQQALIKQAPKCPMDWVLPGGAGYSGELPQTAQTMFEWTGHPDAAGYELLLTQPDGSQIPYESDSPSKALYMENYKQAGEYFVELFALDGEGNFLCSINLTFSKDAVQQNPSNGGDGEPSNPPVIIIPTLDVPR